MKISDDVKPSTALHSYSGPESSKITLNSTTPLSALIAVVEAVEPTSKSNQSNYSDVLVVAEFISVSVSKHPTLTAKIMAH